MPLTIPKLSVEIFPKKKLATFVSFMIHWFCDGRIVENLFAGEPIVF